MSKLAWTFVLSTLLTTLIAIGLEGLLVRRSYVGRHIVEATREQNAEELSKLGDTEIWRGWFVREMQRHDVHMGLEPLPWPGPLLPLPPEPTTRRSRPR